MALWQLSYLMFHWVTGVPFQTEEYAGAYDDLTLWEQIDGARKSGYLLRQSHCPSVPSSYPAHSTYFSPQISHLHSLHSFRTLDVCRLFRHPYHQYLPKISSGTINLNALLLIYTWRLLLSSSIDYVYVSSLPKKISLALELLELPEVLWHQRPTTLCCSHQQQRPFRHHLPRPAVHVNCNWAAKFVLPVNRLWI